MRLLYLPICFALLGALVLGALVAAPAIYSDPDLEPLFHSLTQYAAYLALSLVLLTFFAGVVALVFRAAGYLASQAAKATATEHSKRWHRFVALAIVLGLFPALAMQLYSVLYYVTAGIFVTLPESLIGSVTTSLRCIEREVRSFGSEPPFFSSAGGCWSEAAMSQIRAYTGWLQNVWRSSGLFDIPLDELGAALAIFVVLSLLLTWLFTTGQGQARFWFGFACVSVVGV